MKCYASLTTSTVPDPRARDVAAQFEGLLFAQALAPLAKTCGFLGDTVIASVATDLARHDGGPLASTLTRSIESARRDAGDAR